MSLPASSASLVDASWFFREFVMPNYRDFIADQLSPRRAFNAAVSIAHMTDHIVVRSGGTSGQLRNARNLFRERCKSFRQVEAMCNAFKHVHATGGGSQDSIVMTSTDLRIAETDKIHFVSPVDGKSREFRPLDRLLVCDFKDNGGEPKIWVGWALYCALKFVAKEAHCEGLISDFDQPSQVALAYRSSTSI